MYFTSFVSFRKASDVPCLSSGRFSPCPKILGKNLKRIDIFTTNIALQVFLLYIYTADIPCITANKWLVAVVVCIQINLELTLEVYAQEPSLHL